MRVLLLTGPGGDAQGWGDMDVTRSVKEAAEGAEALVLMVATAGQAEGALFGEGGAAEALPEGSAVVVMSTIGPEAVRELAGGLAGRGLRALAVMWCNPSTHPSCPPWSSSTKTTSS